MHTDTLAGRETAARTLAAWRAYAIAADAALRARQTRENRTRAFLVTRAAARAAGGILASVAAIVMVYALAILAAFLGG